MDQDQLTNLRHSLAHLLAAAVLELYPRAKRTIGPAVENGFYYDFDFGDEAVTEKDLPRIEKEMKKLMKTWKSFERREVSAEEARELFQDNPYKLELIEEFVKEDQRLSVYVSGNFSDLCRGGHADNLNQVDPGCFKLAKIAGAYWRGNSKNKMLTRIYGYAFDSAQGLKAYLEMLQEAEKRDHKKLGVKLDLFTFSELVGPGLPLWTPKGTVVRNLLDEFIWGLRRECGYQKVEIPHITKKDLYETSGHWSKFKDDLFQIRTRDGHLFAMKPMNCPHHTQIYARKLWSYKELPQRYANTTMVYRDEQTGELTGLSRVLSITQDDAHVFCRFDQAKEELGAIWDKIVLPFYRSFGFSLQLRLSLHDPKEPDRYLGDKALWQKAEEMLRALAQDRQTGFFEATGEAAFYGPKLDFMATDSLGRQWQVATIQLDMNMPERFDLCCVNEKGDRERIVMLHAAIMGSTERFLSVLIEHLAGNFPLWLSPVQLAVLPISSEYLAYAHRVAEDLKSVIPGLRIEIDERDDSIGKKVRESEVQKVPYSLIIGQKERESGAVSVRSRGGRDLGQMGLKDLAVRLAEEISTKNPSL